jgi:tetratricopeptide (TPR) repeat protein
LLLSLFFTLCLPVFFAFFSNYLYHLKKDSADGRLFIARVSMEMVKEAPVLGTGISGFRAEYLNYQADYFRAHPDSPDRLLADDVETPFNEFLKILIEQGIIGLLLFISLLYILLKKGTGNYILQSVILFISVFGLFSYPFDRLPFAVLFVFSAAVLSRYRNPVFTVRLRKMRSLRIPLLFALCLVSGLIAWNSGSYGQSCLAWNRALKNSGTDREESLLQLKNLYPELENNPVFLTAYGKVLSFDGHAGEAIPVLEKAVKRLPLSFSYIELGKSYEAAGFPGKALECWEHAGMMVPARFTPLYLTMKLHFQHKEYGLAREYAGQLLAKKIKIDSPGIISMKREARDILNFHPPPESP